MRTLQTQRHKGFTFLGKEGFMTIRDLLKIASRSPMGYDELAHLAFSVIGERLKT